MHKALLGVAASAALGLVALTPGQARASWLSELLHAYAGPAYYGGYYEYAPPYGYGYYAPAYSYGNYGPDYYAGPWYGYSAPYYAPYRAYGYYRPWHG
jgi:hypothetical protein